MQVSAAADGPARRAASTHDAGSHTQTGARCAKLATVVDRAKFTTLATVDVPWYKFFPCPEFGARDRRKYSY